MLTPFVKSLRVYRFSKPVDHDAMLEKLMQECSTFAFTPCTYGQKSRIGFQPFMGENFVHVVEGTIFLKIMSESRKVPAKNLRKELNRRIEVQEDQIARKLTRAEKNALKDTLEGELLEKAFPTESVSVVVIDPRYDMVLVGNATAKQSENCLALVRKTLGSLPIVPVSTNQPPQTLMTNWLREGAPRPFILGEKLAFAGMREASKARVQYDDLHNVVTEAHLNDGEVVTQLQLILVETCVFTLHEDFSFTGMRWDDMIRDQNMDEFDEYARVDADCLLFINHARQLIAQLAAQLGGIEKLVSEGKPEAEAAHDV